MKAFNLSAPLLLFSLWLLWVPVTALPCPSDIVAFLNPVKLTSRPVPDLAEFGGEMNHTVFSKNPGRLRDFWINLTQYEAGALYSQLVIQWAKLIEKHYGETSSQEFLLSILESTKRNSDSILSERPVLIPLQTLRRQITIHRPPEGQVWTLQRIKNIQTSMAHLLKESLVNISHFNRAQSEWTLFTNAHSENTHPPKSWRLPVELSSQLIQCTQSALKWIDIHYP